MLFFEKKEKKPFPVGFGARPSRCASGGRGAGAKVFCFFFSKNKAFVLLELLTKNSA
jgi:hypothetical protein